MTACAQGEGGEVLTTESGLGMRTAPKRLENLFQLAGEGAGHL